MAPNEASPNSNLATLDQSVGPRARSFEWNQAKVTSRRWPWTSARWHAIPPPPAELGILPIISGPGGRVINPTFRTWPDLTRSLDVNLNLYARILDSRLGKIETGRAPQRAGLDWPMLAAV